MTAKAYAETPGKVKLEKKGRSPMTGPP